MKVQRVQLENFRNHSLTRLEFGSGLNVLLGRNGQGKTNVLEAISCLSLTKSFYAASDITLVRLGQEGLSVEGVLANDAGIQYNVRVTYARESGEKVFTVNGVRTERLASVIGMFPVVILSPENSAITFGPPSERRKFVDLVLSQLSCAYFDDLLEYRQALRQRNKILDEAKQRGNVQNEVLEPWNQNLARYGARIVHRRIQFVVEFSKYVIHSYSDLVQTNEEPGMRYLSAPENGSNKSVDQITQNILIELGKRQPEERRRGITLVGPHRDDLVFQLNGIDLQKYASQGQHKTFLIALKMAEFFYLKEKREETPILLLDDVLSELDDERSRRLLSQVTKLGQTVVTTTKGPHSETQSVGVTKIEGTMLSKGRVRRLTSATARKQPLAFNTALNEFAASVGITKKLREYNVLTSWETIVGEQIAKVAKPQRIDNRILLVAVDSSPWRAELSMRRREIIEKINAAVGKKVVQDIRFR